MPKPAAQWQSNTKEGTTLFRVIPLKPLILLDFLLAEIALQQAFYPSSSSLRSVHILFHAKTLFSLSYKGGKLRSYR